MSSHAWTLAADFLRTHRDRIREELRVSLASSGQESLLPLHLSLLEKVDPLLHESRDLSGLEDLPSVLGEWRDALPQIVAGQMALWSVVHRLLWQVEGPHRLPAPINLVLALLGDALDGLNGALIDMHRSGRMTVSPEGWETLVELGRTCREYRMLQQVTYDLLNAEDPARMFEILEQGILGAFHLRSLNIAAVHAREGTVEIVRSQSYGGTEIYGWHVDLSHPDIICEVARKGRTEVIDGWDPRYYQWSMGPDGKPRCQPQDRAFNAGMTAFFIPVLARGQAVGVLCTGSTQENKEVVLREIDRMDPFLHQIGATLSTMTEVAERKRAEASLRESEERYRSLVESTSDWIWEVDASGCYTYSSPKVRDILGYEPEEVLGRTPFDLMPPEERERIWSRFRGFVESRSAFSGMVNRNLARDGRIVVLETSGVPMWDEGGGFRGYRGIDRDITARQQAEERLVQSEARFRNLFEAMADGVIWITPDGRIRHANPAAERLLAIRRDEIEGRSYVAPEWLTLRPDGSPMPPEEMAGPRAMSERRPVRDVEMGVVRPDGEIVWLNVNAVPLLNEAGGLEGVVGTFSDITDRKTAEKALREAEGLKVLTQTAAATAHEIYQPLTVVCGYAEILLSEPMPDRTARTRIEAILKAGRKIQEIVDQMKELHRYITKPYALGQDIVDFDRASRKDPPADQ